MFRIERKSHKFRDPNNNHFNKRPLIVACTSDVIDHLLEEELKKAGFDMMFQAPITDA